MKKAEYKIVSGTSGFKDLEENVSSLLNQGWKLIGGIGFNSGYAYQAMARVKTTEEKTKKIDQKTINNQRGAQDAMRAIDELT